MHKTKQREAMTDKIKIIQDISLLYELSLSIGTTLDPQENCYSFLRTLITRKSLNFGSVWLKRKGAEQQNLFDLFGYWQMLEDTMAHTLH